MVVINTVEDLIRAMDEHPEWLDAMRSRLLTSGVLEMPQRLEAYERHLKNLDHRLEAYERHLKNLDHRLEALERHLKNLDHRLETLERHLKNLDRRLERQSTDISFIKGELFERRALMTADAIAGEMGLTWKRTLTKEDIRELIATHDTSNVAPGRLKSFRLMDLAMEAVDREGNPCWIVVEASCTVDERDTTRALKNARLLTRFTGIPARAAVIGIRKDNRILGQIEAGDVFYCEMDEDEMLPR